MIRKTVQIKEITNEQGVCFRVGDWYVPTEERLNKLKKQISLSTVNEYARPQQILAMVHNKTFDIEQVTIKIDGEEVASDFVSEYYRLATPEEIRKEKVKLRFHPITVYFI